MLLFYSFCLGRIVILLYILYIYILYTYMSVMLNHEFEEISLDPEGMARGKRWLSSDNSESCYDKLSHP